MAESLGDAVLSLRTDDSQLDDGLRRAEGKAQATAAKFEQWGSRAQNIGAKLSLGLTAPIGAFAVASVNAAQESAEAMGQVTAALDSMGGASGRTRDQLAALAEAQMGKSLYDDDDILRKVTANLLTFGNVSGAVFDQGQQAALDMAARLGGDLQGATLMVGKALNDPIAGITALTRTGVQFTAQQKEQIKAMVEAGDRAGAQGIILTELQHQFGGAAQAMRDADPAAAMRQSFATFQENVGGRILPLLPSLTNGLGGVLDAFAALPTGVQSFTLALLAGSAALGPLLGGVGTMARMVPGMIAFASGLTGIGVAGGATATGATAAGIAVRGLGASLLGLLANPIVLGAAALIGGIYLAWKNWDQIEAILTSLGAAVSDWWNTGVQPVLDAVGQKITAVVGIFRDGFGTQVGNVVRAVSALLRGDFAGAWAAVVAFVRTPLDVAGRLIEAFVPGAIATFQRLYTGVREWLETRLGAVFDAVRGKVAAVGDAFRWLWDKVVGHSWVPDLVDGIEQHFGRLDGAMVKPALDAVAKAGGAFADLQRQYGQGLTIGPVGTGEGLGNAQRTVFGAPTQTPVAAAATPAPVPDDVAADWREKARSTFHDGIRAALDGDLGSFFQRFIGDATSKAFDGAIDWLFSLLGGGAGGGGGGSIGSVLSSLFGSSFAGGFATGGMIPAGKVGLVGERGPELAIASPNGTLIRPNASLAGYAARPAGASITVPISIDATGADPAALGRVRDEIAALRRDLPSMTLGIVQDGGERGMLSPGSWR